MSHLCGAHKANKGGNIRNGQCTAYFFQQNPPRKKRNSNENSWEGNQETPVLMKRL